MSHNLRILSLLSELPSDFFSWVLLFILDQWLTQDADELGTGFSFTNWLKIYPHNCNIKSSILFPYSSPFEAHTAGLYLQASFTTPLR